MLADFLLSLHVHRANKHGDVLVFFEVPPRIVLHCLHLVILHLLDPEYFLARRKLLNLMVHRLRTDQEMLIQARLRRIRCHWMLEHGFSLPSLERLRAKLLGGIEETVPVDAETGRDVPFQGLLPVICTVRS